MIVTENLPLEGRVKISGINFQHNVTNLVLKRNITGTTEKVTLQNLSVTSAKQLNTKFGGTPILSIFNNDSLWVAVGYGGLLATSTDGENWTLRNSSFGSTYINYVYFANGVWVAVGGSGKLAISTNGITWTQKTSGFSSDIFGIGYGFSSALNSNIFMIVGVNSVISISSDNGNTWVTYPTPDFSLSSVCYHNGLWVLTGAGIYTSPTGVGNWTKRDIFYFCSVSGNDKLLVAVGGGGLIKTSADGVVWITRSVSTSNDLLSVRYCNGIWMAMGANGALYGSIDGESWQRVNNSFGSSYINNFCSDGKVWVVVGDSGAYMSSKLFYLYDNYAKTDTQYTYSFTPIISGAEGDLENSEVLSVYCDSFICNANHIYKITDDLSYNNFERKKRGSIADTYGRKYPIDHSFGISNYTNGSIDFHLNSINSANIVSQDEIKYRKEVLEFLSNKGAKIIKDLNGNIWLVALYNSIPISFLQEMGNQVCNVSTEFIAIGDANTQKDLAKAGMLNKFIIQTE